MKSEEKSNFRALGTDINIRIVANGEDEAKRARKDVGGMENLFRTKQRIFCRFNSDSELSQLNENLGPFQKASPDILYLASRALHYNKISGGLYDPRIIGILEKIGYDKYFHQANFEKADLPKTFSKIGNELENDLEVKGDAILFKKRMDFSGIAKGYIVDQAEKYLKNQGWKNFLVDAGGDMFASGKNREDGKWLIEIEGVPKEKMMLEIADRGVATSGIIRKKWQIRGRKFHHLSNTYIPNEFAYECRTVTVIAENTENSDGRAKVLVLMGKEKGLEFAEKNKIAAIFLDYKGNIHVSSEAKKYIYPNIQC